VNGEQREIIELDSTTINESRDPDQTRGPAGIRISRYSFMSSKTVDLSSTENLIEAIAFDAELQPRTSKVMKILYNPYTEEMQYNQKVAMIIGVNDYRDERIPDLREAVNDADTVKYTLEKFYDFNEIFTLSNEEATFSKIRNEISRRLGKAGRNDLVLIYFAGHGEQKVNARTGEETGYILPCDAEYETSSSYISMSFINEQVNLSDAKDVLLIVDACYSGLGIIERPDLIRDFPGSKVDYEILHDQFNKLSRTVISAGDKREEAVDGLFTRLLKNGLRGAADYNRDEYITSTELGFYLKQHVSREARNKFNREQNPQFGSIISDGGELILKTKK
jgi:hypothetical protein